MELRAFLTHEEEDIARAASFWWADRGAAVMAGRVGKLIRTPGVVKMYLVMRESGEEGGFAEMCAKTYNADLEVVYIVEMVLRAYGAMLQDSDDEKPALSGGA